MQPAFLTVSSWEIHGSLKLPARHRLPTYARFFATRQNGIHSRGVSGAV